MDLRKLHSSRYKVFREQPLILEDTGSKIYRDSRGYIHRGNDQPAVITAAGRREWWRHGYLHRDFDKPAIVWRCGLKAYYRNGNMYFPIKYRSPITAEKTTEKPLEWSCDIL